MNDEINHYLVREKERHIRRLVEYIRQPSPNGSIGEKKRCAGLLASYLRELGFAEVEIISTDGAPGIWAYYDAGSSRTVATYLRYDTQPVTSQGWTRDPYGGEYAYLPSLGKVLFGRGTKEAKGPTIAWLNALEAIISLRDNMPCNLAFLCEGEELEGSPYYIELFEMFRHRFQNVSLMFTPGFSQNSKGQLVFTLGCKGNLSVKVEVFSKKEREGFAGYPVHGMLAPLLQNPAWRLTNALASLLSSEGEILVDGFLAGIEPPTNGELKMVNNIVVDTSDLPLTAILPGIHTLTTTNLTAESQREREDLIGKFLFNPSINLNGFELGSLSQMQLKFHMPTSATATLDIRLVRNMLAHNVLTVIKKHLVEKGFNDINVVPRGAYDWYQTNPNVPEVTATLRYCQSKGVPVVLWPHSGGGGPWSLFAREFSVPIIRDFGLGYGSGVAEADEYLLLESENPRLGGFVEAEWFYAELLWQWAQIWEVDVS
jgi:acetylornithine deacetylase/succinyl-diaminopimelate desuccinylase-like protein